MHDTRPPSALARLYFPPAPWLLRGSALAASFAVRAEAVAPLVPEPLQLVRVIGGLAFGFLGVARYTTGSTLEYSELVAGVMVRASSQVGPHITHVGVSTNAAQRAGQELWHLPKQHWEFEWEFDQPETSVRVWDGARLICTLSEAPLQASLWPMRTRLQFLNSHNDTVELIPSAFDLRVATVSWQLQLGPDGPLTMFKPVGPVMTLAVKGTVDVQPVEAGTPAESTTDNDT